MTTKSLPPEMVSVCDQLHAVIQGELSKYLRLVRRGITNHEENGLVMDEAQAVATLTTVLMELVEVAPNTAAGILAVLLYRVANGDLTEKKDTDN